MADRRTQRAGNNQKTEKTDKMKIKHDPQAESARAKFGKNKGE